MSEVCANFKVKQLFGRPRYPQSLFFGGGAPTKGFNGFADFQNIIYDWTDFSENEPMKENSDNVDMDVDDDDDDNNISENFLVKRIKTFSFEDYIWIKKKNPVNKPFRVYKNRLFFNKKYY